MITLSLVSKWLSNSLIILIVVKCYQNGVMNLWAKPIPLLHSALFPRACHTGRGGENSGSQTGAENDCLGQSMAQIHTWKSEALQTRYTMLYAPLGVRLKQHHRKILRLCACVRPPYAVRCYDLTIHWTFSEPYPVWKAIQVKHQRRPNTVPRQRREFRSSAGRKRCWPLLGKKHPRRRSNHRRIREFCAAKHAKLVPQNLPQTTFTSVFPLSTRKHQPQRRPSWPFSATVGPRFSPGLDLGFQDLVEGRLNTSEVLVHLLGEIAHFFGQRVRNLSLRWRDAWRSP